MPWKQSYQNTYVDIMYNFVKDPLRLGIHFLKVDEEKIIVARWHCVSAYWYWVTSKDIVNIPLNSYCEFNSKDDIK